MKQLRRHSRPNSKAWASLDCLLTALPITPPSRTLIGMRSNGALQMTDSRRISPQTTSSSGYHSDLSSATSANESPQSLHDATPTGLEPVSLQLEQKRTIIVAELIQDKSSSLGSKNLSRLSSFLRKQFERAKSKLVSTNSSRPPPLPLAPASNITTCSKATSTTPYSHLSEDNYTLTTHSANRQSQQQQHQQQHRVSDQDQQHRQPRQHYLSSVYQQTPFSEPVYSVYVHPTHRTQLAVSPQHNKNYVSIHDCYSQQPTQRLASYPIHNSRLNPARTHQYSSSYRRMAAVSNYENASSTCLAINNGSARRHHYYAVEPSVSHQNYNRPYRFTNNNYDCTHSTYAPLSDFISTPSAFKPIIHKQQIRYHQRPQYPSSEQQQQQLPSDDPCDLEVAQYFRHTPQWSNPNYFDIYKKELPTRKTFAETLC